MPRGYSRQVYVTDTGYGYALRVDADYAQQGARGWTAPPAGGLDPLPRYWRPRYVFGFDTSGRKQTAIVASLTAPLWTGTALTFTIEATDDSIQTVTVVGRVHERTP